MSGPELHILAFCQRLLTIATGLIAALLVVAAIIVIGNAIVAPDQPSILVGVVATMYLAAKLAFSAGPYVWTTIGAAIVAAEARMWRCWVYYTAACLLVAGVVAHRNWPPSTDSLAHTIIAVVCAGLVYRLVAGRNAGKWRPRRSE